MRFNAHIPVPGGYVSRYVLLDLRKRTFSARVGSQEIPMPSLSVDGMTARPRVETVGDVIVSHPELGESELALCRSTVPDYITIIEDPEVVAARLRAEAERQARIAADQAQRQARLDADNAREQAMRAIPWLAVAIDAPVRDFRGDRADPRPILAEMRRLGGVAPPWHRRMRTGGAALFLETLYMLLRAENLQRATITPEGYGNWLPRSPSAWALRAARAALAPVEFPPEWAVLEDALMSSGRITQPLPRNYAAAVRSIPRSLPADLLEIGALAKKTPFGGL